MFVQNLDAQQSFLVRLEWLNPELIKTPDNQFKVPMIKGQELSGETPNYSWIQSLPAGVEIKEVKLISSLPALADEKEYPSSQLIGASRSIRTEVMRAVGHQRRSARRTR